MLLQKNYEVWSDYLLHRISDYLLDSIGCVFYLLTVSLSGKRTLVSKNFIFAILAFNTTILRIIIQFPISADRHKIFISKFSFCKYLFGW